MNLNQLKCNQRARITSMSSLPLEIRKKLMVMGILPQTEISVLRKAPMGDPLQIRVRGSSFAIRKNLAEKVIIEELVL